jgi:hypothetical protein
MDRTLVFEDFADKVGQGFAIAVDDGAASVAATLAEAELLNPGRGLGAGRVPFSLIFVADHPAVLPQRLYRIEHQALGPLSIFLVPIARDARGVSYQATFN